MAVNSLSPAFVKVNYTTPYGSHVMTIPTVGVELALGDTMWKFLLRGLALPTDAEAAIIDYINLLKPFMHSGVTFQDYTLFQQPAPTDVPTPVQSGVLGIAGTHGAGDWEKAAQQTITWRADDFTLFKVVLLDFASDDNWNKVVTIGGSGRLFDLNAFVTDETTFLASRGGGRPTTFLQLAKTLNEKLRRSYGMN